MSLSPRDRSLASIIISITLIFGCLALIGILTLAFFTVSTLPEPRPTSTTGVTR